MFRKCYGIGEDPDRESSHFEQREELLDKFEPPEVEQLACVYDYLRQEMAPGSS